MNKRRHVFRVKQRQRRSPDLASASPARASRIRTAVRERTPAALCLDPVAVRCAFCGGKGRDAFGVMSRLASCQACGGRGFRRLRPPTARCAFCRGTGIQPGVRLTCAACGGVGTVEVPAPAVTCALCEGSGRADNADDFSQNSPFYCLRCGGKGVIPVESGQV